MAGAVMVLLGLYLVFAPIDRLARKPSPIKRELRRPLGKASVPTWMRVFFRGLGLVILAAGCLLLAPLVGSS
jgi:hypothetical protein